MFFAVFISILTAGLILCGALLLAPNNRLANRCLGGLLVFHSFVGVGALAQFHGIELGQPVMILLAFSAAICVYLMGAYVKVLLGEKGQLSNRDGLLFALPALIGFVGLVAYYKAGWWFNPPGIIAFCILIFGFYLYTAWRDLKRFEHIAAKKSRRDDQLKLTWLHYFLGVFAVACLTCIAVNIVREITGRDLLALTTVVKGVVVYGLAFGALRHSRAIDFETFAKDVRRQPKLSSKQIDSLKTRLRQLMEKDNAYLDPDLRIASLAQRLRVPEYQISEVINRGFSSNFYDLTNSYRIEAAKQKLEDPAYSHTTILGIAMEVGFNSKSAFHTAFRKYANTTPSAFRRENLNV